MRLAAVRYHIGNTLLAILLLADYEAFASSITNSSPMSNALCIGASWLTGNVGRAIGTIAVVAIGIWKLLGKVSGRTAIVAIAGIAVVFGSSALVTEIGGTSAASGGTSTTNCT